MRTFHELLRQQVRQVLHMCHFLCQLSQSALSQAWQGETAREV